MCNKRARVWHQYWRGFQRAPLWSKYDKCEKFVGNGEGVGRSCPLFISLDRPDNAPILDLSRANMRSYLGTCPVSSDSISSKKRTVFRLDILA